LLFSQFDALPPHPLHARLYELLNSHDGGQTPLEHLTDWGLIGLVLLNTATVVLDSVKGIDARYHPVFAGIELVSIFKLRGRHHQY
jgi:hypothetical protein